MLHTKTWLSLRSHFSTESVSIVLQRYSQAQYVHHAISKLIDLSLKTQFTHFLKRQ